MTFITPYRPIVEKNTRKAFLGHHHRGQTGLKLPISPQMILTELANLVRYAISDEKFDGNFYFYHISIFNLFWGNLWVKRGSKRSKIAKN